LAKRKARWYDAVVAPVLLAFAESAVNGGQSWPFILNVVNHHTVPWLPPEAIVETPVLVQHGRALALTACDAPPSEGVGAGQLRHDAGREAIAERPVKARASC
jgi:hypothetical protein